MTKTFDRVQTGREAKRIGIEIEFFGVNYQTVINTLRARGLQVADYMGYTHAVIPQWKITTDGSVPSTGTGLSSGLELVSPPLTLDEMERQLKIACDVLNELGAKVNKDCGIHVHHEIDDLNLDQIKNIYRIYDKHTASIDEIMPESRRASSTPYYCKGVGRLMSWIESADSIQYLTHALSDRYHAINFCAYVKYGTIEFRQHSGSTDFRKIFNWILITQSLVAAAKKKKAIKPLAPNANATVAFNQEIGTYNTEQGIYVRDRKAELRKQAQRRAA